MNALLEIEPAAYAPHPLHAVDRAFPETNCYTDLWIELLHALGREPLAMLAPAVSVDFEGDHWTFLKPAPRDLELLYGAEVQELVVYRALPEHIAEQLDLGRPVIMEVDAYYLPCTAGRSYREEHEKTSVAVTAIDPERERLRYFHGRGCFDLVGDDYRSALRVGRRFSSDVLPPYVELVRFDRLDPCPREHLRATARTLLGSQLERLPTTNPVSRFGARLAGELPRLCEEGKVSYHRYAFATVRQCGAAWQAAAAFLSWLDDSEATILADAATVFDRLAEESKTLLFKLARAATTRQAFDALPAVAEMSALWDEAGGLLAAAEA